MDGFAGGVGIAKDELNALLKRGADKLMEVRDKRIRPALDDKIILGWNALMTVALCKASAAFSSNQFKALAVKNAEFILQAFRVDEDTFELMHTFKNGIAKYPAFLDDYAAMISACIALQEITSDKRYLTLAEGFTQYILDNFQAENGFFFYTSKQQIDVIVRKQELYDGAIPSGNSLMACNLYYLGTILGKPAWINSAMDLLSNVKDMVTKYPSSFGNWATVLMDISAGINEIAITGNGFEKLRDEMLDEFIPNKVLQSAESPDDKFPLLAGKNAERSALIYVCRNYSCQLPVNSKKEAIQRIVKKI